MNTLQNVFDLVTSTYFKRLPKNEKKIKKGWPFY